MRMTSPFAVRVADTWEGGRIAQGGSDAMVPKRSGLCNPSQVTYEEMTTY
jgi:hypothetical protein